VTILVLAKNKTDTSVQFIDATGEAFFAKKTNNNIMEDGHIAEIMKMFDSKETVPHVAETVDQAKIILQDYNLSVSAYVEPKDNRLVTDITMLNADLKTTVAKINQLRTDIDAIVAEIEA
jgi:type I restriction enzyme M protein